MKATEFDNGSHANVVALHSNKPRVLEQQPIEEAEPQDSNETVNVAGIEFGPNSSIHRHRQADSIIWQKMKNWD